MLSFNPAIQQIAKKYQFILFFVALFATIIIASGNAHAATFNVATGTDETTTNGSCALSEAIGNINDQAQTYPDCLAGDGSNDTISIPAGTITLSEDILELTNPAVIQGAGMGDTIIDGDNGQYSGFYVTGVSSVSIKDLSITAYNIAAIYIVSSDLELDNIEVDGTNADSSGQIFGIAHFNSDGESHEINSSNVYIHSITTIGKYINAFLVALSEQGHTEATVTNTTLYNIHSTGSEGINGLAMHVGTFGGSSGTINANISNTTITNITGEALTAPFNGVAFTNNDGDSTVDMDIDNITITNTHGANGTGPLAGIKSGAFYAVGSGAAAEEVGTVNMTVSNSLMANNTSSSVSSNCAEGDFTSIFGGSGQGIPNIVSAGYNISDDDSCEDFNQPGDQQNVNNILSTLGPLQNNGGMVPTMELLSGSPAIGAGSAVLGISTDARGVARDANHWDVGAYQTVLGDTTTTLDPETTSGQGNLADTGSRAYNSLLFIVMALSTASILFKINKYSKQ